MGFWRYVEPGLPAALQQLPPLTDATIAACEAKFGVKLPKSLLELLRTQNGGLLENTDFCFGDWDCGVSEIYGLTEKDAYYAIKTYTSAIEDWDMERSEQFRERIGDPRLILALADNDYESYALDYSRLNADCGPTVLRLMMGDGDIRCDKVADSFAEFLQCQNTGDEEPTAAMEHADNYELLAEGGYSGHHREGGTLVEMGWKICADGNRFVVFTRENWGLGQPGRFQRAEFKKSALLFDHRLAKWELQEAGDSELTALLRRAVGRFEVLIKPDCYVLRLGVAPGAGDSVSIKESVPHGDRWKNTTDEVIYTQVYSSDRTALEEAMRKLVESI